MAAGGHRTALPGGDGIPGRLHREHTHRQPWYGIRIATVRVPASHPEQIIFRRHIFIVSFAKPVNFFSDTDTNFSKLLMTKSFSIAG